MTERGRGRCCWRRRLRKISRRKIEHGQAESLINIEPTGLILAHLPLFISCPHSAYKYILYDKTIVKSVSEYLPGCFIQLDVTMADEECVRPYRNHDKGKLEYGCHHYRRRCKIRAPCCNKIFPCRHCHNEAVSSLNNSKDQHELVRQDVEQVTCSLCNTEQQVAQVCSNCGVKMGEYFCNICKFYDDDTSRGQFHCEDCGICRVGGRDKFFHCQKCGSCYSVAVRENHVCVENSMKNHCPVCYEYLFDSIKAAKVMDCGHTMHMDCFREMAEQNQYRCPICSKTVIDMSDYWMLLEMEIEANRMPEEYQYDVPILCNDCNSTSEAPFHILGQKCRQCNSYNTRRISTPDQEADTH